MAQCNRKAKNPARALALFCLLAAAFVSSDLSLWHARSAVAPTVVSQLAFIARLSLNDSAVNCSDSRLTKLERDASRRSRSLGVPAAGSELTRFDFGSLYAQISEGEPSYALALISPPSNRAPPCATA